LNVISITSESFLKPTIICPSVYKSYRKKKPKKKKDFSHMSLLFTNIQEEFYGNSGKVLATENPNTNSPKASQLSHFPQDSENTTNNDNLKPSILETRNLNLIKKLAQLGFKFVILKPRCDIVVHTEVYT
jgi:hypothetical protein